MDVNSSIVETDRWWESLKHPSVEKASMAKTHAATRRKFQHTLQQTIAELPRLSK